MKISRIILILLLIALIAPIFSICVLSVQYESEYSFKNFAAILNDYRFLEAFGSSVVTSLIVAFLTVLISFVLSLSWFHGSQKLSILLLVLVFGLLPPDIIALSIGRLFQYVGVYGSTRTGLILGLLLFTLPFGVLIFWSRFYYINRCLITASRDVGLNNLSIICRVIWPLAKNAAVSCFVLSFLLSFNEYTRTYYLSGADEYLSEYLNGKLSAGTDQSIYAAGSLTIVITVIGIGAILILNYWSLIKSKRLDPKR